jgi:hypothetical protein
MKLAILNPEMNSVDILPNVGYKMAEATAIIGRLVQDKKIMKRSKTGSRSAME